MNIPSIHIELASKLWDFHKIKMPIDQVDPIISLGSYEFKENGNSNKDSKDEPSINHFYNYKKLP